MAGLKTDLVEYLPGSESSSGTRTGLHAGKTFAEDGGAVGVGTGLVYESAADFEAGDTHRLFRTDAELVSGDSDFTVAMFIKPETIPADASNPQFIADIRDGGSFLWGLFVVSDNGTDAFLRAAVQPSSLVELTSTDEIAVSVWNLAWFWHDSVNDLIWVQVNDGTPVSIATGGALPSGAGLSLSLGSIHNTTFGFDGLGLPYIYWSRILTSNERTRVWNNGDGLPYEQFGRTFLLNRI